MIDIPWFNVDDQFHSHPKARRAGLEALGLWAVAGSYCMGYKTDGFVAEWFVTGWKNGRRQAAALVTAGLWKPAELDGETGWLFHDWGHFQKTAEDIEKDRAAARERQRQRREKQRSEAVGSPNVTRDKRRDSRDTSAEPPGSTPHHSLHPSDVSTPPADADALFAAFWKVYPRREDRGHAIKAFRAALKKASAETITAAAAAFAERVKAQRTEKKFIALATTWLNGERWLDDQTADDDQADWQLTANWMNS